MSLWFLAIYAVVMVALTILFTIVATDNGGTSSPISYSFVAAASIFLLVLGISTYSTFVSEFVFQGVTRKDFFKGMVASVTLLALAFTLILAITVVIEYFYNIILNPSGPLADINSSDVNILMQEATGVPYLGIPMVFTFFANYMLGLMIGMTFYGHGVIKGLISVAFAVVLYNITGFSNSFLGLGWDVTNLSDSGPTFINAIVTFLLAAAVTIICYFVNRNANVKITTT